MRRSFVVILCEILKYEMSTKSLVAILMVICVRNRVSGHKCFLLSTVVGFGKNASIILVGRTNQETQTFLSHNTFNSKSCRDSDASLRSKVNGERSKDHNYCYTYHSFIFLVQYWSKIINIFKFFRSNLFNHKYISIHVR